MPDIPDTYDYAIQRKLELAKRAEVDDAKTDPPPPPEIPGYRPTLAELEVSGPAKAAALWRKAEGIGWTVDACFSRGPLIGLAGERLDTADMLSLGFRWIFAGPPELVVSWVRREGKKWEFDSGWIRNPGDLPTRIGGNDVTYWLTGEGPKPRKIKEPAT